MIKEKQVLCSLTRSSPLRKSVHKTFGSGFLLRLKKMQQPRLVGSLENQSFVSTYTFSTRARDSLYEGTFATSDFRVARVQTDGTSLGPLEPSIPFNDITLLIQKRYRFIIKYRKRSHKLKWFKVKNQFTAFTEMTHTCFGYEGKNR